MTPLEIIAEIEKKMTLLEVRPKDLIKVCGKSKSTLYKRLDEPEKLTVEDLMNIGSYLGMELSIK